MPEYTNRFFASRKEVDQLVHGQQTSLFGVLSRLAKLPRRCIVHAGQFVFTGDGLAGSITWSGSDGDLAPTVMRVPMPGDESPDKPAPAAPEQSDGDFQRKGSA
jgi:hypothetical protein